VTKVPATPTQTTGPAAARNRRQPICIPPSNKMTARATVTTRWTVVTDTRPRAGMTSEATAAASRKIAGGGPDTFADPVGQHRGHDRSPR
jgi:hypothetical protein